MGKSTLRVLVADDYEAWRSFAIKTLQQKQELQVVGEVSDGLEAVQKAQELQPDLILLDIGLPTINGIEAARQILQYVPKTKILFLSEQRSPDIVNEALKTGADGYVVKSRAANELLPAMEAVLQGKQFVTASLNSSAFGDPEKEHTAHQGRSDTVSQTPRSHLDTGRRHEVGFYSDDRRLLDDVMQFICAAINAGHAAIVIATDSHRNSLLSGLHDQGVDLGVAIEQGRYIALDATEILSTLMVDDAIDPVRFMETFGNLIRTAAKTAIGKHPRVVVYGEGTHLLWTQGYSNAAIQDEKLCNELTKIYDVDFLCTFSEGSVPGGMDTQFFQQICDQHSAVYSL